MTTIYDVPAADLIEEVAEILKNDYEQVTELDWISAVKAGVHRENPPQVEDWWYIRCASILRKLYIKPMGISKLRNLYGGRMRRGPKPNIFMKGSGSIVRNALKQLESAGLVEIIEKKGRKLTSEGQSLLDRTALKIKMKLQKSEIPGLVKY